MGRSSDKMAFVQKGRVPKENELLSPARAVFGDDLKILADELLGELFRIG
ncbi:MAG: hypothetical protein ACE5OR_05705 [bacterium]